MFSYYTYSSIKNVVGQSAMLTSTVVLNGNVIIEGVKFLWWVTDGRPARITVSHAAHGTLTKTAESDPEQQARLLARGMLAVAMGCEPVSGDE
jgi:hypothetical protein